MPSRARKTAYTVPGIDDAAGRIATLGGDHSVGRAGKGAARRARR